jgi:hypothetical protein
MQHIKLSVKELKEQLKDVPDDYTVLDMVVSSSGGGSVYKSELLDDVKETQIYVCKEEKQVAIVSELTVANWNKHFKNNQ